MHQGAVYRFCDFEIDRNTLELKLLGDPVCMEPQVFSLLLYLIENRERVVSKDELVEAVWQRRVISDATLNSRMNSLRRAIKDTGKSQKIIKTYYKKGYRFVADLTEEAHERIGITSDNSHAEHPAIAVLPFHFASNEEGISYLSKGISEEITAALSRMRWLIVISASSVSNYTPNPHENRRLSQELGVDYILSGNVQTSGTNIRILAQLIDATSREVVWSCRFGGQVSSVFDLQDEVTYAVSSHLQPEISRSEIKRLQQRKTSRDFTAWEWYLDALQFLRSQTKESNEVARTKLLNAAETDRDFVLPQVALAWCWALAALNGWSKSGFEALTQSKTHAREALLLDPSDAQAHCAEAFADFWAGRINDAMTYAIRALELNPNLSEAYGILGSSQAISGHPEKAIASLNRAMKGSPNDPFQWFWSLSQANAHFALQKYQDAAMWAERTLQTHPLFAPAYLVKSASLFLCDEVHEANALIRLMSRRCPKYDANRIERNPIWTDQHTFERLFKAAKLAGLGDQGTGK